MPFELCMDWVGNSGSVVPTRHSPCELSCACAGPACSCALCAEIPAEGGVSKNIQTGWIASRVPRTSGNHACPEMHSVNGGEPCLLY